MKVFELINELQKFDQNLSVKLRYDSQIVEVSFVSLEPEKVWQSSSNDGQRLVATGREIIVIE